MAEIDPEKELALERAAAGARQTVRDEAHRARESLQSDAQISREISNAERLARLETQLLSVSEQIKRYVEADLAAHNALSEKVDDLAGQVTGLVSLKEKGMGAIWLASAILGTGLIGIVYALVSWFKN